ncbi:MAG TPA: hypothetical protein VLY23_04330, partial [Candidatus Acidoferrum sp.]|nr:hypothetical protein [Candidatus Acidoferrum sp.]
KGPPQEKIEKEDDDDCRHSSEEQLAEAVEYFHCRDIVLRSRSWLTFLPIPGSRFAPPVHVSTGQQKDRNYRIRAARRQSFAVVQTGRAKAILCGSADY